MLESLNVLDRRSSIMRIFFARSFDLAKLFEYPTSAVSMCREPLRMSIATQAFRLVTSRITGCEINAKNQDPPD